MELWADVPGFEGYQISNLGRVRSCRYGTGGGLRFGKYRLITPSQNGRKSHWMIDLVCPKGKRRGYQLHRLLYELFVGPISAGYNIDHIDRNGMNNSLDNLRLATISQNVINQNIRKGRKYKGVSLTKSGKWECRTSFNGKQIFLGRYLTETEAAKAYNDYARKNFGEYAVLNPIPGEIN